MWGVGDRGVVVLASGASSGRKMAQNVLGSVACTRWGLGEETVCALTLILSLEVRRWVVFYSAGAFHDRSTKKISK